MVDLHCTICAEWLIEPVTLLCQHTYCQTCIRDRTVQTCPMCRMAKFAPPEVNDMVRQLVKDHIGEPEYNRLMAEKREALQEKYREWHTTLNIERSLWRDIAQVIFSTPAPQAIASIQSMQDDTPNLWRRVVNDFMQRPVSNICSLSLTAATVSMSAALIRICNSSSRKSG